MIFSRFEPDPCEGLVNELNDRFAEIDDLRETLATTERQRDDLLDVLREVADIVPLGDLKRVHAVLAAYDDPERWA